MLIIICKSTLLTQTLGCSFYLALILNSVASIMATSRSGAKPFYHSYQVNQKHSILLSGTIRTLVGCESSRSLLLIIIIHLQLVTTATRQY